MRTGVGDSVASMSASSSSLYFGPRGMVLLSRGPATMARPTSSLARAPMLAPSPSASIPPGPRRRPCLEPPRSPAWPAAPRNRPASIHVAMMAPHVPAGAARASLSLAWPRPRPRRLASVNGRRQSRTAPAAAPLSLALASTARARSLSRRRPRRAPETARHRPSSHGRPACTRAGGLGHAGEDTARRRPRPSPCSPVSNRPGPGRINFRSPARAPVSPASRRRGPVRPSPSLLSRMAARAGAWRARRPASINRPAPSPASLSRRRAAAAHCRRIARQWPARAGVHGVPGLRGGMLARRKTVSPVSNLAPALGEHVAGVASLAPAPAAVSNRRPARNPPRQCPSRRRGPGPIRRAVPGLHGPNSGPWRRPRKRRYLCHKAAIPASDRRGAA